MFTMMCLITICSMLPFYPISLFNTIGFGSLLIQLQKIRDGGHRGHGTRYPRPKQFDKFLLQHDMPEHHYENSWIPLTKEEQWEYLIREKRVCKNPLHHCCIGQGRQLISHHKNVSQLFIKWSQPLANLDQLLDYMSKQNIPCNIWFVGFSMSGDHAIGALCELMRDHGYQLDGRNCIPYKNDRWNEKDALNCSMSEEGMPSHYYHLINPQRPSCPRVRIAHDGIGTIKKSYPHNYSQLEGVAVVNQGVHCNEPGCVTDTLKMLLGEEGPLIKMREQGWHILWRETEHQHFDTPNGYHQNGKWRSNKCRAISNNTNDYRNEEAHLFLSNLSLTKNITIPVVQLARATEHLHFMHAYDKEKKVYDCTHYVYSPWRFEVTWNGILHALYSNLV
jgi:hypothetical protein